jgi:hypothetical protein
MVKALEAEMTQTYSEYMDLHEELNKHRGKPIEDTDLPEVNRLLKEIQEKFHELYNAYHFIDAYHQHAITATTNYTVFIDTIKKAGALEIKGQVQ